MTYVANQESDTVPVIDGNNNSKIADIPVGHFPFSIAVDPNTNMTYVANTYSNSISAIDGSFNKLVAGILFN
jgi:YVTN family beta-propeller protein